MPTKLTQLPGTDEEVTCDNWREFQVGDYAWYVPTDAKTVDDVKLVVIAKSEIEIPEGSMWVHVVQECPSILISKGRLSLAESKPTMEGEAT